MTSPMWHQNLRLQEQLYDMTRKFNKMKQSRDKFRTENEKLKEDISLMRRGLWIGADSRKTTLGKLDKEIEGLKKQNQELFDELEHMKKEHKNFNGYLMN